MVELMIIFLYFSKRVVLGLLNFEKSQYNEFTHLFVKI